jgi:hypothetical protein
MSRKSTISHGSESTLSFAQQEHTIFLVIHDAMIALLVIDGIQLLLLVKPLPSDFEMENATANNATDVFERKSAIETRIESGRSERCIFTSLKQ